MIPLPASNAPPPRLVDDLCRSGLVEAGARFQTLYGGRTNQVWKVLGGDGDKVLKLYRSGLRNPLFRNDARLEALCLTELAPTGFAPRLRAAGQDSDGHWVFYDHAPGAPWQTGAAQVAQLLRRLHSMEIRIDAPDGCNGSDDLRDHTRRILGLCKTQVRQRLEQLCPQTHVAATPDTCLIHGDPVAGNILVSDMSLTLIDWQCPALGDPCEDIALFLSPAMQRLYRGAPLTPEEEEAFLTSYDQPQILARFNALRPWYAWRMAAYCLWRIENGADDYAAGLELEIASL
ncbi:phosphotransferase family protein [Ruegeria lacuscaerulensis]|uniref:phosphotransferase family protein n=1 Tax=Ruegeria lacuscaerulensis TaxID=55218 RepID=UPI003014189E